MKKRLGGTCQIHMKSQPCSVCMAHGSKQLGEALETLKRKKGIYIGAPACFELELAVRQVREAFGGDNTRYSGCYVVGSALEREDWRDVDVRMIMEDKLFAEHFPNTGSHGNWEFDAKWILLTVAISAWLSKQTGLPVDFQFQPQTHANERHKKPRNAIGMRMINESKGGQS